MHVHLHDPVSIGKVVENQMPEYGSGTPAQDLPVSTWRKSSYSGAMGNCVEVGSLADGSIAVRNSRHPSGPALVYTHDEITAFVAGVKAGEFDDLA